MKQIKIIWTILKKENENFVKSEKLFAIVLIKVRILDELNELKKKMDKQLNYSERVGQL